MIIDYGTHTIDLSRYYRIRDSKTLETRRTRANAQGRTGWCGSREDLVRLRCGCCSVGRDDAVRGGHGSAGGGWGGRAVEFWHGVLRELVLVCWVLPRRPEGQGRRHAAGLGRLCVQILAVLRPRRSGSANWLQGLVVGCDRCEVQGVCFSLLPRCFRLRLADRPSSFVQIANPVDCMQLGQIDQMCVCAPPCPVPSARSYAHLLSGSST